MIIQYDTRPNATVDEKLKSLIESIQLALGEVESNGSSNEVAAQTVNTEAILSLVRNLVDDVQAYDETIAVLTDRLDVLEARWTPPDAPTTDGAYSLTVTVTDGVPVYTWESV